jgi:carbonic anhydrase/acetyltransferase-like protein (isoleucine patch superfamily)
MAPQPTGSPGQQNGGVLVEHAGRRPWVHPDAYVAPTAVLSGGVRIGADSRVLFGAVLTDDGGAVEVGERCVIMEHAVLRGTRRHPVSVGNDVLIGPHASVSGATIGDEVFIATGAMVFNGARMGAASSVALGGAVHIGCRLESGMRVPIGWVAVGDPPQLHPPDEVDAIRNALEEEGGFLPYVFGTEPGLPRPEAMRAAMARYTRGLAAHETDHIID